MKRYKITNGITFHLICGIILWFLIVNAIGSAIGYISFTNTLTEEYTDSALKTAQTAALLVNGDDIDTYLTENDGKTEVSNMTEDYGNRLSRMDALCQIQATLIYVIKVDTTDYEHFYSVFNTVNEETSGLTPWQVGAEQDTNEQYRQIYVDIYENGLKNGVVTRTSNLKGREAHITVLIPVKNSADEVTAILCVEKPMSELTSGRERYLREMGISALLLAVLASISLALFLRKKVVVPTQKIGEEAKRFATENTAAPKGTFEYISKLRELEELSQSIEKMEGDTLQYIENLTSATKERERISTELALAHRIQANVLPNLFPPFPDRSEFDIFASMTPAKEVGGDFYDFFMVDDNRLALVIADVSGKGVPAALFMMAVKNLIKSHAMLNPSPEIVLQSVNREICKNNADDMFVTVWLGVLDVSTGKVIAANAGHEYPVIKRKNGTFELIRDKHGFVVGGMDGAKYKNYEINLQLGDSMFLYTDGVAEAADSQNNLFGTQRMLAALNSGDDDSPENVLNRVNGAITSFTVGAPQFDDITMLSVRLNYLSENDKIIVAPAVNSVDYIARFLSKKVKENGISSRISSRMQVCADEIFSNIMYYSKATDAEVVFRKESDEITLVFSDDGVEFDPTKAATPDISLSAEERKIGGLGIYMVKQSVSSMEYSRQNGKNVLTLTFRL